MPLSVSVIASKLALTTVEAVRADIGHPASDDPLISTLIEVGSSAIVSYCHRSFARESYTETLPGFADIRLQLSRTPIISVTAMTLYGNVVTSYAIENADRGWIYSNSFTSTANAWTREPWPWSVQSYAGLSGGGSFMDRGSPGPRQEEPIVSVDYTAGYILPSQFLTASTISAAASDNSFNDSASGFPALIKAGDIVHTSGFTSPGNNGRFLVAGTPTAAKIIVSATLTTEAAGNTISFRPRPPATVRSFEEVEQACIEAVKSWYTGRRDDTNVIEKQAGPMRLRYSEKRVSEGTALPPVCVGLLRSWVRA